MQANPFDQFDAPQRAAAPARIYGAPKRVDPMEAARFDLSLRSDARADRSADRQDAAALRAAAAAERAATNDSARLAKETQLTESQSKDTNFYNGAVGAEREWNRLVADPGLEPGTEAPGLMGDAARSILPRNMVNSWSSASRQQANQAKENFIRASLRLESGAAIGDTEFYRQDQIFFPQTGDAPDTIAQKARARQQMIEGFRISAGPGAPKVDALQRNDAPTNHTIPVAQPTAAISKDGSGERITDADRRFAQEASDLFAQGGGRAELDALAEKYERRPFGAELDSAIKNRAGHVTRFLPTASERTGPSLLGAAAGSAFGSFVGGAADTITMGGLDEIIGATGGNTGDARLAQSLMRADHPYANVAGQIAGGAALPSFGASGVGQLARLGAAYGGAYGFGSADGDVGDRLAGAATGAVAGGTAGAALAGLGRLATNRLGGGSGGGGPGAELMAAAQRQGVDVLPADVGGPMTRRFTSGAAQGPLSAGPIIRGGQRASDQMMGARDRIATSVGNAVDPVEAGEIAQQGAANYIRSSRQQVGRLYDDARNSAGGVRPVAQRAIDTLDANLAELAETPGTSAPVTAALEKLGGDLSNPDGLTIDGLRRLRTNVRGLAQTDELRGTDFQRRAGQVLDSISDDISDGLPQQARDQFRAADQAHRARIEAIDQVIKPIIGGRNDKAFAPEDVFKRLQNTTRSDSAKLRRFVDTLQPDEQNSIRATVISQLGRASNGTQNAEGSAFSASQFLTHWNALTPRAKDTLFRGEARDALNDLARIADGTKQAQGYANRANTGGAVNVAALLGIGAVSRTAALGVAGAQVVTGHLLASPRFARILARPATSPQQVTAVIGRLSSLAAREPQIANDILPVQRALQSALPTRAAATENNEQQRRQ